MVLSLGLCDVDLAVGRADVDSILARASGGGVGFLCATDRALANKTLYCTMWPWAGTGAWRRWPSNLPGTAELSLPGKGVESYKQVEAALPRSGSLVFPQRDNVLRLVVPSGAPRTFGHAHSHWCGGGKVLPHYQEDVIARFQALPGSVTVRVWCLVIRRVDYALGGTGIQLTNALALRWPHLAYPCPPLPGLHARLR